jgi:hypothetical protein
MDPELLKLIHATVKEGVTSVSWTVMIIGLLAAGIGAFLGSYLKRRGEMRATTDNFEELLRQLKAQTEATQAIQGKYATDLSKLSNDLSVLAHKRTTRFSEWHSRQITILSELYRRLYRAEEALRPSISDLTAAPIEKSWMLREELRTYFEENAVFIPDQIWKDVDYLLNRLSQVLLRKSSDNIAPEEEKIILDVTGNEIPQLRDNIREQIKIILAGD